MRAMSRSNPEQQGSFLRFVVISTVLLTIMCGTAYAIFAALYATQKPGYTGPEKIKIPENAPFR